MPRTKLDFIDYYDCDGKANGNYIHPSDPTRFIICSNGNAADMACPDCDLDNNIVQCAGSPYLMYDHTTDRCEWPANITPATDSQ